MTSRRLISAIAVICVLSIVVASTLFYHYGGLSDDDSNPSNANVVAIEDFNIQDIEAGSFAEGSVIVQKNSDELVIRVIGAVNVGDDDFGGVCFYFDGDMELNSIVTSYRDELGAENVMIERIPSDLPFPGGTSVSFGRTPMASGDGVFEIVYEYVGIQSIESIDSVSLAVAVGSYYIEGTPVVGHVYKTIEIGW